MTRKKLCTALFAALFAALCSFAGFIAGGIFMNPLASWAAVLIIFMLGMIILPKLRIQTKA